MLRLITLFFIASLFASCGSNQSCGEIEQELSSLKQRIQNDSLLIADFDRQVLDIDMAIDEIAQLTQEAEQGGSRRSVQDKIATIETIIADKIAAIEQLEKELDSANSSKRRFSRELEDKKQLIEMQLAEINDLKNQVGILRNENQTLANENVGLQQTVQGQNQTITQISNEVAQAQQRLNQLNQEIAQKEQQAENLQRQMLNQDILQAQLLAQTAEKISKPAVKQELVQEAVNLLCSAHQNGDYQALGEITKIRDNRKLDNAFKKVSCNCCR